MSDAEKGQQSNDNQNSLDQNNQMRITNRINELAAKDKNQGLSDAEMAERDALRKEFIANFRKSFSSQLEMLKVIDNQGDDVTPEKIKEIQRQKGLRDEK